MFLLPIIVYPKIDCNRVRAICLRWLAFLFIKLLPQYLSWHIGTVWAAIHKWLTIHVQHVTVSRVSVWKVWYLQYCDRTIYDLWICVHTTKQKSSSSVRQSSFTAETIDFSVISPAPSWHPPKRHDVAVIVMMFYQLRWPYYLCIPLLIYSLDTAKVMSTDGVCLTYEHSSLMYDASGY